MPIHDGPALTAREPASWFWLDQRMLLDVGWVVLWDVRPIMTRLRPSMPFSRLQCHASSLRARAPSRGMMRCCMLQDKDGWAEAPQLPQLAGWPLRFADREPHEATAGSPKQIKTGGVIPRLDAVNDVSVDCGRGCCGKRALGGPEHQGSNFAPA
jgi:hypothetical protein